MIDNNNPPVFPFKYEETETTSGHHMSVTVNHPGITLMDYYAAMAMQAMISKPGNNSKEFIALQSYEYAEEMLKSRKP